MRYSSALLCNALLPSTVIVEIGGLQEKAGTAKEKQDEHH